MQYPDGSVKEVKNGITAGKRCIQSCREVLGIYNALSKEEKALIPPSLIKAICLYAGLEEPEDQPPAEKSALRNMSDLTSRIMELLLFCSGTVSKREARAVINKNITVRDHSILRRILVMKKKLELEAESGGENGK